MNAPTRRSERSLIERVEGLHAVARCLEAYLVGGMIDDDDTVKANNASAVAGFMADELRELFVEIDDDHVVQIDRVQQKGGRR